jgi:hypothetical protein
VLSNAFKFIVSVNVSDVETTGLIQMESFVKAFDDRAFSTVSHWKNNAVLYFSGDYVQETLPLHKEEVDT